MVRHARLLSVLLMGVGFSMARAQEKPPAWDLSKPFAQKWTTTVKQSIKIAPAKDAPAQPKELNQVVGLNVFWTPVSAATTPNQQPAGQTSTGQQPATQTPAGPKEVKLKLKIDGGTIEVSTGEDTVKIDLAKPADSKNPLAAALKKCLGTEFTFTIETPSMRVLKLEFPENWAKDVPSDQKQLISSFLAKDTLIRQAQMAFPSLPAKKGEKNTLGLAKISIGSLGSFTLDTTLTNDGLKDNLLVLNIEGSGDFQPAAQPSGNYAIQAAEPIKLAATGVARFDPKKGLLHKAELTLKDVPHTLNLVIGKVNAVADVSQTYTYVVEAVVGK